MNHHKHNSIFQHIFKFIIHFQIWILVLVLKPCQELSKNKSLQFTKQKASFVLGHLRRKRVTCKLIENNNAFNYNCSLYSLYWISIYNPYYFVKTQYSILSSIDSFFSVSYMIKRWKHIIWYNYQQSVERKKRSEIQPVTKIKLKLSPNHKKRNGE